MLRSLTAVLDIGHWTLDVLSLRHATPPRPPLAVRYNPECEQTTHTGICRSADARETSRSQQGRPIGWGRVWNRCPRCPRRGDDLLYRTNNQSHIEAPSPNGFFPFLFSIYISILISLYQVYQGDTLAVLGPIHHVGVARRSCCARASGG
jgi:hypothetical protein